MAPTSSQGLTYRYRFLPTPGYDFISPEVRAVLGYDPEDFYADPDFDLSIVHPHDQERLRRLIAGAVQSDVLRVMCRDGSFASLEFSTLPVYDEQGELIAVEGLARVVQRNGGGGALLEEGGREPKLSTRELQILRLVVAGLTDADVSRELRISQRTVEHHMTHIRAKLHAPNRAAAAAAATRLGIVPRQPDALQA